MFKTREKKMERSSKKAFRYDMSYIETVHMSFCCIVYFYQDTRLFPVVLSNYLGVS